MSKDATNVVLLVLLCIGVLIAIVSYTRYRHYKITTRYVLPPVVTAHIIDQPGGEYVRVVGKDQTVFDWEHDS